MRSVDTDRCGDCVDTCPNDCLDLVYTEDRTIAMVVSDACAQCGACASVCPTGAVTT